MNQIAKTGKIKMGHETSAGKARSIIKIMADISIKKCGLDMVKLCAKFHKIQSALIHI